MAPGPNFRIARDPGGESSLVPGLSEWRLRHYCSELILELRFSFSYVTGAIEMEPTRLSHYAVLATCDIFSSRSALPR